MNHPFVQSREQAVQDRAVGVEQFVEEDEGCLGQHPVCIGPKLSLPQTADIKWAEEFVRLGEPGQQIGECLPVQTLTQGLDQSALGRARWTEDEKVLAAEQANPQQIDD